MNTMYDSPHVTLAGDRTGDYLIVEERPDGGLLILPERRTPTEDEIREFSDTVGEADGDQNMNAEEAASAGILDPVSHVAGRTERP